MKASISALLLTLLFVSGCATTRGGVDFAELAIQIATAEYIDGSAEKASRILAVTDQVLRVLDQDAEATVSELRVVALEAIDLQSLSPGAQIAVMRLVDNMAYELDQRIGSGALASDRVVAIRDVLSWSRMYAAPLVGVRI